MQGEEGAEDEGAAAEAAQQEEARDFSQDGSKYRSIFVSSDFVSSHEAYFL